MIFSTLFLLALNGWTAPLKSDHFDGQKFFNPHLKSENSFFDVIKWKLTSSPSQWPSNIPNKNYKLTKITEHNHSIITFINHSSFLIQLDGLNILTDPIFSERAGPFRFLGPGRVRLPGIQFEELPPIDVVLISHNHYDHLDLESLRQLDAKFHPLFLVPLGNELFLKSEGIQFVKELEWWEEFHIKDKRIILTPAQHWSARTPFDRMKTLWGGYFIDAKVIKIFFAGDTGYSSHFVDIRSRLGNPNVSLLPIGSYEPSWFMKPFHLNPEEAVMAHHDLLSEKSIGMHYGTFQLSDEAYERPLEDLILAKKKLSVSDSSFMVLDQGQSFSWPKQ
ncbi:MAG: MBL fold metallo-hydrolase [Bacteriovoracaceae bacterium]